MSMLFYYVGKRNQEMVQKPRTRVNNDLLEIVDCIPVILWSQQTVHWTTKFLIQCQTTRKRELEEIPKQVSNWVNSCGKHSRIRSSLFNDGKNPPRIKTLRRITKKIMYDPQRILSKNKETSSPRIFKEGLAPEYEPKKWKHIIII